MKTKPTYQELLAKVDELENRLSEIAGEKSSEQKDVENKLSQRNAFIETVLENLPIGIAVTKYSSGKRTFLNKKFEEIYGWPRDEIMELGNFFRNIFPDPQIRRSVRKEVLDAINEGDPSKMAWSNLPATTQTGKKKVISALSIPLFDQDLVIGAVLDNTDNFNIIKQLKESEE